jgi:tetratricopeptide (TPR) repeat protein
MKLRRFTWLALALAPVFAAQAPRTADNCTPPPSALAPTLPARLLPGMGTVHLPITTASAEAQQFFDQGLAQMHSFWAREAERSFLQAAALDPTAPMPQWGVAMVAAGDWRPRFQIDLLAQVQGRQTPPSMARARAAARKAVELAAVPGKASDLEKLYVASIAARRNPEAKDADEDFVRGLRAVLAKYPQDVETQLDLALMVMRGFSSLDRKPLAPGTMEAVAILRGLLIAAPEHPGVHHYVIHGFEGSPFAKDAWLSCEKYAQLVPNIPHAIHMPGHIYSQTGRWDDAVKAFSAAAVNERGWMKQDKFYGDGHHGHNVHYLATSYSFEGRYEDAVEAAKELLGFKENPGQAASADLMTSAYAQGWFAMLRTQMQFGKWDAVLDENIVPVFPRPRQEAWRHWARAIAQANKGNLGAAAEESRLFEASLSEFQRRTSRPEPAELQVARQELAGHREVAQGHVNKGLKQLEAASRAERRLTYTEPPYYPRPVAEALGQAAMKHNKAALAERAFRVALEQYPSDSHAETGLRAAQNLNRPIVASR